MRLIDAEMLAEKKFIAVELIGYGENVAYRIGWNDAIDAIIENEPTAEPKRERCEYCKDGDFIGQKQMLGNDGKWHKILFCPNCGALMREREGER